MQRETGEIDEHKREQLEDFLDDHTVDSKIRELYERMADPSDDTPQLVKKIYGSKKELKLKLKNTTQKLKTSSNEYSKKIAAKRQARKAGTAADQLLGRLQPAKKYTPPKRAATRIHLTEGMLPSQIPQLIPLGTGPKKSRLHSSLSGLSNLRLPKMSAAKLRRPLANIQKLFSKKNRKYTIGTLLIAGVVGAGLNSIATTRQKIVNKNKASSGNASTKKSSTPASQPAANDTIIRPDFPTLVPTQNATTIKDQQRYDPAKKVATYKDKIGSVNVVISQQLLTAKQTGDPTFLSTLATNMYLKTQMDTNNGAAYLGTNVEKHVQTVAMLKGDLLVFIQSETTLDTKLWVDYINSLNLQ